MHAPHCPVVHKSCTVDSLAGKWTIGVKDGTERCSIALDNDEIFGLRKAWTSSGCAGGRTLDITSMAGEVVASFRKVGPDRFEGRRASDGSRLYMSK